MKDILHQPKFKGDEHKDKPISEFKARGGERIWGRLTAMEQTSEPVEPFGSPSKGFAKSHFKK